MEIVGAICSVLLYPFKLLRRLVDSVIFFHKGVPEAAEYFIRRQGSVATVNLLRLGRVTFVSNAEVADRVFNSPVFHARLGEPDGLRALGMHERGIIWNNNGNCWTFHRKFFMQAVQGICTRPAAVTEAASVSLAAFNLTAEQTATAALGSAAAGKPLRELAGRAFTTDGLHFLRLCTFRIIACLTLGLPVDALSIEEASEVVHSVNGYFKAWEFFFLRPGWRQALYFRSAARHHSAVARLQAAVLRLIAAARRAQLPRDCFLAKLLAGQAVNDMTEEELVQDVLEMVLAGTDTSSVTMYYLLLAARDDAALRARLAADCASLGGSDAEFEEVIGRLQKYSDPRTLPLLHAALSESARFKPVGPVAIRQATSDVSLDLPAGGVLAVQRGDSVIVSMALMHRDPAVFANPDTFNINNFLGDCVCAREKQQHLFRPFGHGRKGCVGMPLAWLEMKVLMAAFFRTFVTLPASGKALHAIRTKWEIASQPTEATLLLLCVRAQRQARRVFLVGAHGVGKTTLAEALVRELRSRGRPVVAIAEVARTVLTENRITRDGMTDPVVFARLQRLIVEAQQRSERAASLRLSSSESADAGAIVISDRCGLDPVAYAAWRFGLQSTKVADLLGMPATQALLNAYWRADSCVLLVHSFECRSTRDDGQRIVSCPQEVAALTKAFKDVMEALAVPYVSIEHSELGVRLCQAKAAAGCAG